MISELENHSEIVRVDDLVEEMLEELDAIEVIFQELVQSKKEYGIEETIYCFYEGNDDLLYYPNRIRMWLEVHSINKGLYSKGCGKRDNVIRLFNKIKFDFVEIQDISLYFVDRDFNKVNHLGREIYVTPCYAIENLYVNENVLERFLEAHIRINSRSIGKDSVDYGIIKDYYVQNLFNKVNEISIVNAWYSIQINKRNNDSLNGRTISIDLKKLKTLSKIKQLTLVDKFSDIDLDMLRDITINPYEVTEEEVEIEKQYINTDVLNNSRGKYIEEISLDLYKKIIRELNEPTDFNVEKRSLPVQIGKNNFKIHLMPFAETPICLRIYLEERLN